MMMFATASPLEGIAGRRHGRWSLDGVARRSTLVHPQATANARSVAAAWRLAADHLNHGANARARSAAARWRNGIQWQIADTLSGRHLTAKSLRRRANPRRASFPPGPPQPHTHAQLVRLRSTIESHAPPRRSAETTRWEQPLPAHGPYRAEESASDRATQGANHGGANRCTRRNTRCTNDWRPALASRAVLRRTHGCRARLASRRAPRDRTGNSARHPVPPCRARSWLDDGPLCLADRTWGRSQTRPLLASRTDVVVRRRRGRGCLEAPPA